MEPRKFTYKELSKMTNGFREKLGEGSYAQVYKGVHGRVKIAVKIFFSDKVGSFDKELENLKKVNHQNIVELVGYCDEDAQYKVEQYNGQSVALPQTHRALCFKFMPGCLGHKIADLAPRKLDLKWNECYKIIQGICYGIQYIHQGRSEFMGHMDIKPNNILLDENNDAKLADFGLSRVFTNLDTRTTGSDYGTERYSPPEYKYGARRSATFDIYSFGVVVLELVAGCEAYTRLRNKIDETHIFIDKAVKRWMEEYPHPFPKAHQKQLKTCIDIALDCIKLDTSQRPTINHIIQRLEK
ncbi:hypothetical protein ACP70R_047093 [Stipagrostis hirtigluma subsp. patula]